MGFNKIIWVGCDNMCKPKSCGDLGVRDLQKVNLISLLSGIENIVGVTVV
jgi:hypothetical protein